MTDTSATSPLGRVLVKDRSPHITGTIRARHGSGGDTPRHGAGKVFREVASGADRAQLRRLLDQLDAGDFLLVTRLDRQRAARDMLNMLAAITAKERVSSRQHLGHTTTAHGRLMLTPVSSAISSAPAPQRDAAGRRSAGSAWAGNRN